MRPPELERQSQRERFDPVVEGDRHGLSRDLSLAIWERVCADATDSEGRRDTEQAERRFHEIAARIAARGGRLRPDVGKLTRVGTEITGVPVGAWGANELAPRTPGRETLVAAEARRWGVQSQVAPAPEDADAATGRSELPGANAVMRAMAALQHSVLPEQAKPLPPAVPSPARRPLDLRLWAPPTQKPAAPEVQSVVAERRDPPRAAETTGQGVTEALATADPANGVAAQLRAGRAAESLAAQMRRTFGGAAVDVAIAPNSTRPLAAGAEGVAVGEQVYIAPGFYDLTTPEGRERLGHEVAHVLQQRRGRDLPARLGAGERAGLEAEADHAGRAFARGERFAVQGRAPVQVALFKGAAPAKAPATTTTIDLKAGGRIERKPPAPEPTAGDAAAAPAAGGKDKPKVKEQLIVTYGAVQASNPFTIERDESGEAKRLVGEGTLTLPASTYMKKLDLDLSLGSDGYVVAKLRESATTTIQIGGLTIQSGTLTAAIDHGPLSYALDGATIALPKNIGDGALTIQGTGDQEPAFDASLTINVPKLQPATMSFHADASGYRAEGSAGVDIKQASGTVTFSLEKVGDDKALWSAAGSVGYNSERLSGQISVQYNADGELSGEGNLNFQIADFLTGQATVAVDKKGHVTVNGEIRPPNETQLFPEKKIENTFFHKSVDFPIWGISIPEVGSVGIIAFIEGSMGYRVGVGAGVMRDIVLSGQYSTDPSVQPTFGITGEIFIPAFAELLISIGGGVKLDAFIADVGGGLKVDGRAGFYGGLSVRPTLAYDGGKYQLTGQAILGGDVGLEADLDAFVKLHVGKWFLSWEKEWDWKLGEWDKWLGLNLGMEADLNYTLGQPLSPDIFKLKKPDSLDVQGIAKSAMPKDGMPPQGPKGAQNEHEEFHAKGGGGAAPASGPAAQPKVAGTPAGAAGHKNQDPKGKNVKPGAPPKSAPPKKAKGKGPGQTGPNPKNNSKPTVPKLDATPIVESFNMHGESHQLIVQLGEGGHVDMASKRERLSVKVGQAVSKLIAKHASPQQVADLKEIGALAKKGDKMAVTAKTHDKEGTTKAAHQIAAYGAKWEVKDLDEVAIKAPHAIVVTHAVHLEKLPDALNKALASAHNGQVIANKPGDPKEVTRQLLEKHAAAHFDYASARLTLPALHPAPLQAAHSVEQLGQLLAQQTGVTKVTLKQTEQKGELKFELIGAIGAASTTLGTAVVEPVPHSLTVPHPFHLDKPGEPLARALGSVHGIQVIHPATGDPKLAARQLLQRHTDAHFDFPTGKLTLPAAQAAALQAAHGLDPLGQLLAQQIGVLKITIKATEHEGQTKLELIGAIGEATATLGTATATADEVPKTLSIPGHAKLDKQQPSLAKEIARTASGTAIWTAPVTDPKQVTANLLHAHKDAHFDPASKNLQLPAVHAAALSAATSLAQLGHVAGQELGVSKITLTKTEHGHFTLEGSINPKVTIADGTTVTVNKIAITPFEFPPGDYNPTLVKDIKTPAGSTTYTARETDEELIRNAIDRGGAKPPTNGTLQLPAVERTATLTKVRGVPGMLAEVGRQTYVQHATFAKHNSDFTVKVGYADASVTPVTALTGKVLMTPEERVVEFRGHNPKAQFRETDRYSPEGGGAPYKETSDKFQNSDYVAHFDDKHPEQHVTDTDALSDLTLWRSGVGGSRLSLLGGPNAKTYIIVDPARYKEVVLEDKSPDPDLQRVVSEHKIVPFMKAMAQNTPLGGIDRARFDQLWQAGPNASWLSDQFRDYNNSKGMHEWIPCQAIPKTIALAAALKKANNWLKGAKWIDLHHEIRSNTRELIGKPELWRKEETLSGIVYLPQGHVGAVTDEADRPQTAGFSSNSPFHLRLVASIMDCNDFSECIANAQKVFTDHIWNDEAPSLPLHPGVKIRGTSGKDINIEQLKREQKSFYDGIMAMFDRLKNDYPD